MDTSDGRYISRGLVHSEVIKFIDLAYQISEDQKYFAFFNTVNDSFVRLGPDMIFTSIEDLKECCQEAKVDKVFEARLLSQVPREYFLEEEIYDAAK